MPLGNSEAVPFGLLAMIAEDMYDAAPGTLAPPADGRIAAAGWNVVAYVTAQDVIIPPKESPDQKLHINHGSRVFYGYVAQSAANPQSFLAAIRGTEGIVEWLIDADFVPIPHPRYPTARVEQGFWSIYQTMSLADLTGVTTSQNAAEGIEKLVGDGSIMVSGTASAAHWRPTSSKTSPNDGRTRRRACLPRPAPAIWPGPRSSTTTSGTTAFSTTSSTWCRTSRPASATARFRRRR